MTTASANSPSTRPDPHPHTGAWLTPTNSATNHPESRRAANQLTPPGVRTGDSGTKK